MSSAASAAAKPALPRPAAAKAWVPDRQSLIWIDRNPQAGGEMRDFHPMLVLSPATFNARTGLVIGVPMIRPVPPTPAIHLPFPLASPRGARPALCSATSPSRTTGARVEPSRIRKAGKQMRQLRRPARC